MRRWLAPFLCLLMVMCALVPAQTVVRRPIVSSTPPTFPVNGVIDSFTRANEGPPPSANWTSSIITTDGGMQVSSNSAIGSSGVINSAWWSAATFGPDCEAYLTNFEDADFGGVWVRLAAPGTAGVDGYHAQFYVTGSQLSLYRLDNGTYTSILTVGSFTPAAGDSIGISAIGSSIELWYKVGAGAWISKGSVTDSTYSASGNIGMTINGAKRVDDFGGGTR